MVLQQHLEVHQYLMQEVQLHYLQQVAEEAETLVLDPEEQVLFLVDPEVAVEPIAQVT